MKKIKRLFKVIIWRLRGSPRCRRCGKPLYNKICLYKGEFYGTECLSRTQQISEVKPGHVFEAGAVNKIGPETGESYHTGGNPDA